MVYFLAALFVLSILVVVGWAVGFRQSFQSLKHGSWLVGLFAIAFAAIAIISRSSPASPFTTSSEILLGADYVNYPVIVGLGGALLGVIGSYFFKLADRKFSWRELLPPICASPFTIIPVIKLIEANRSSDQLSLLLLFGLAYQSGFFWERLINSGK
jgi:hypothetical protein